MYRLFTTEEFEKRFKKLDSQLQSQIEKEIDQQETIDKIRSLIPYYREEIRRKVLR